MFRDGMDPARADAAWRFYTANLNDGIAYQPQKVNRYFGSAGSGGALNSTHNRWPEIEDKEMAAVAPHWII